MMAPIDYSLNINYPSKSKYKYIKDTNIKTDPYIHDYQLKPVKMLSKPDLVIIYVNTKYLILQSIDDKSEEIIMTTIDKILYNTR